MIIAQRSTEHKRTEHSQLFHCTVRFRSLVKVFSYRSRFTTCRQDGSIVEKWTSTILSFSVLVLVKVQMVIHKSSTH